MFISQNQPGFSLLEVLVSVAIFSFILLAITSFALWMYTANAKVKADSDTLENARRVMDIIAYEIKGAKSVYTPTTGASQLSLETLRYLPADEINTFIDFFLCGSALCLKKESQLPVVLNSDSIQIASLAFSHLANGSNSSVKISMTASYKNPGGQAGNNASVTLQSTVSLRSY